LLARARRATILRHVDRHPDSADDRLVGATQGCDERFELAPVPRRPDQALFPRERRVEDCSRFGQELGLEVLVEGEADHVFVAAPAAARHDAAAQAEASLEIDGPDARVDTLEQEVNLPLGNRRPVEAVRHRPSIAA